MIIILKEYRLVPPSLPSSTLPKVSTIVSAVLPFPVISARAYIPLNVALFPLLIGGADVVLQGACGRNILTTAGFVKRGNMLVQR